MRRSLRLALVCAIALLSAPALSLAGSTDLPSGSDCGNTDYCASGLRCYGNKCGPSNPIPAGAFNECSETNCCTQKNEDGSDTNLVCNKATNRCAVSLPGLTELKCGGGEQTPDLPDIDDLPVPGVGGRDDDGTATGGSSIEIPKPDIDEPVTVDTSSGTQTINPDGSVDVDENAAAARYGIAMGSVAAAAAVAILAQAF